MVLFLNFFFVFDKSLVISNGFIESCAVEAALDFQREASIATQLRESKVVNLFISLDLRDIQVLLFGLGTFTILLLFSNRLLLFKDVVGLASFVG